MTPLKAPITVDLKSVEGAIIFCAINHCGSYLIPDICRNLGTVGIRMPQERLERMLDRSVRVEERNKDRKIARDLMEQGIDWLTWEPPAPISIGKHPVEFKSDGVQVGCTFVSKETVRAIVDRLNNPVKQVERKAVINVHNDETLGRIVQDLAFSAGCGWMYAGKKHTFGEECIRAHGVYLTHGSAEYYNRRRAFEYVDHLFLDARTQFGEVVDFFRQPVAPVIKIKDETVQFGDTGISIPGYTIPRETVLEIAKRLEAK